MTAIHPSHPPSRGSQESGSRAVGREGDVRFGRNTRAWRRPVRSQTTTHEGSGPSTGAKYATCGMAARESSPGYRDAGTVQPPRASEARTTGGSSCAPAAAARRRRKPGRVLIVLCGHLTVAFCCEERNRGASQLAPVRRSSPAATLVERQLARGLLVLLGGKPSLTNCPPGRTSVRGPRVVAQDVSC